MVHALERLLLGDDLADDLADELGIPAAPRTLRLLERTGPVLARLNAGLDRSRPHPARGA